MFYNKFQKSGSLELFNPTNKEILENWNFTGKNKKIYNKLINSYIYTLDSTSKMQIPKNPNISLGIIQGFIIFQIYLFSQKNISIEISFSDTQNIKHRIIFSSNIKELNINYFSSIIPIIEIPIEKWINLSIDLLSFINVFFQNLTFKSIDNIILSAYCNIRRIFTMNNKIYDFNDNLINVNLNHSYENNNKFNGQTIPNQFIIKGNNVNVININLNYESCFYNNKSFNNKLNDKIPFKNYLFNKNQNFNFHSKSLEKNNINKNNIFAKYENDNDKINLYLFGKKFKNSKNKNENYYKNDRYNLINKGIINTTDPIVISNNSSVLNSNINSNLNSNFIFSQINHEKENFLEKKGRNNNFSDKILKDNYKQDIAQITQSMKDFNRNLNYDEAGEHINKKKK
jgi:hypothetical protein